MCIQRTVCHKICFLNWCYNKLRILAQFLNWQRHQKLIANNCGHIAFSFGQTFVSYREARCSKVKTTYKTPRKFLLISIFKFSQMNENIWKRMNGDLTRAGDTEYAEMKVKTMCWCYFSSNPQRDGSKQHHEENVGLSKDAEVKWAHYQCTKTLILFAKSWA